MRTLFFQLPAKCQEGRYGWNLHCQEGVTKAACGTLPRSTDSTHDPNCTGRFSPQGHTKNTDGKIRAERSPRGVHNTSAALRQPHMKKVSSFSTNSGTVSLMSNSWANTTTNNTTTKLMSTVLMVRIPFSAFTWVSAARETWDLQCLPCAETNEKGGPKTQKDRQAQCHQRTPVTISFMSNSSGKRIMTTTRQCCLGILTAPTAQAGRKSWCVSATRGREGGKKKQRRGDLKPMATRSPHYITSQRAMSKSLLW